MPKTWTLAFVQRTRQGISWSAGNKYKQCGYCKESFQSPKARNAGLHPLHVQKDFLSFSAQSTKMLWSLMDKAMARYDSHGESCTSWVFYFINIL